MRFESLVLSVVYTIGDHGGTLWALECDAFLSAPEESGSLESGSLECGPLESGYLECGPFECGYLEGGSLNYKSGPLESGFPREWLP